MRSTLLLTLTLFLAACNDATTSNQLQSSNAVEKETVVEQTQTAVTPAPLKEESVAVEAESKPATPKVQETAVNGHTIFVHKCVSCHGKNGEKVALNVSQVIAGWDKERTITALKGYRDGSYGKSLKGIMKGQVSSLNDEQIEAVAEYIAIL